MQASRHITTLTLALFVAACAEQHGQTGTEAPLAERTLSEEAVQAPPLTDQDSARRDLQELDMGTARSAPVDANSALVLESLRHCADLLQRGAEEEARSAYRELREMCTGCALPETLERAVATLPESAQPRHK